MCCSEQKKRVLLFFKCENTIENGKNSYTFQYCETFSVRLLCGVQDKERIAPLSVFHELKGNMVLIAHSQDCSQSAVY
jgi:hypothetical protein